MRLGWPDKGPFRGGIWPVWETQATSQECDFSGCGRPKRFSNHSTQVEAVPRDIWKQSLSPYQGRTVHYAFAVRPLIKCSTSNIRPTTRAA